MKGGGVFEVAAALVDIGGAEREIVGGLPQRGVRGGDGGEHAGVAEEQRLGLRRADGVRFVQPFDIADARARFHPVAGLSVVVDAVRIHRVIERTGAADEQPAERGEPAEIFGGGGGRHQNWK